ncbi:MAG: aromatic ring-hydroxylating dioxygenase subunit alpha [Rhodospirillales bacterium]
MNVQKTHYGLTEAVDGLPAGWYYDPAHYQREMAAIWRDSWVYVCHASEIAEPRCFRTIQIGDQDIVVLRAEDGGFRAFHNACRHRGSVICTEHKGKLNSKLLVCPYHQWSYAADDGRLVRTTSVAEPANFDKADFSLYPVAIHSWRGCLFVNLDPNAVFDPGLVFDRSSEAIDDYPLEDLVVIETWRKTMACNWKTFWENFNECLHCPNIHPELSKLVPVYGRRISDPRDLAGWEARIDDTDPAFSGGLRQGAETWSADGSAQGHLIPGISEANRARGQRYVTSYPGMFIGAYGDHVRTVRILPLGPEETEIAAEWLVTADTAADESYDRANIIDFAILVMGQDAWASELNQRGLHAAPFKHGVLMPEEHWVKSFHDWVRARVG